VNNIYEALQLGKIVCYADDSYLILEGDFCDEVCKIASTIVCDGLAARCWHGGLTA
jgi:hypothetical protein